ncbi:MAG: hypothetical protein ACPGPF_10120, partial [Pontibacterium sp.]
TIIVPAWAGFEVLQHMMDFFNKATIGDAAMKHSYGMVFCSAKTPIRKADSLARELADNIKDLKHGRNHNLFDYAVLESIDYPTEALDKFWQTQFGGLAEQRRPLAIRMGSLPISRADIAQCLDALPRTAMYRLLESLVATPVNKLDADQVASLSAESLRELAKTSPNMLPHIHYAHILSSLSAKEKNALSTLGQLFQEFVPSETDEADELCNLPHTSPAFWLHLVELFDYLAPELPNNTNTIANTTDIKEGKQ